VIVGPSIMGKLFVFWRAGGATVSIARTASFEPVDSSTGSVALCGIRKTGTI